MLPCRVRKRLEDFVQQSRDLVVAQLGNPLDDVLHPTLAAGIEKAGDDAAVVAGERYRQAT